jgi:sortase A
MRRLARLLLTSTLVAGLVACGDDGDERATATTPVATPTTTTSTTPPTAVAPTASTPSTTTTSAAVPATSAAPTTPIAPTLPAPVDPPLEDGSREDTFEVATIEIPRIGLTSTMWEGIRLSTLNRGPGHWPGTALPGELGNVVVAGHRTSHNAEFRHLDDLEPGDEVIMSTLAGRFTYRVVGIEVVTPDALWIVDQAPAHTATLFACHPPGSVRERIVAHLELAA